MMNELMNDFINEKTSARMNSTHELHEYMQGLIPPIGINVNQMSSQYCFADRDISIYKFFLSPRT